MEVQELQQWSEDSLRLALFYMNAYVRGAKQIDYAAFDAVLRGYLEEHGSPRR